MNHSLSLYQTISITVYHYSNIRQPTMFVLRSFSLTVVGQGSAKKDPTMSRRAATVGGLESKGSFLPLPEVVCPRGKLEPWRCGRLCLKDWWGWKRHVSLQILSLRWGWSFATQCLSLVSRSESGCKILPGFLMLSSSVANEIYSSPPNLARNMNIYTLYTHTTYIHTQTIYIYMYIYIYVYDCICI